MGWEADLASIVVSGLMWRPQCFATKCTEGGFLNCVLTRGHDSRHRTAHVAAPDGGWFDTDSYQGGLERQVYINRLEEAALRKNALLRQAEAVLARTQRLSMRAWLEAVAVEIGPASGKERT